MAVYDEFFKEKEIAESTKINYMSHITAFCEFCKVESFDDLELVTAKQYKDFTKSLSLKASTVNNYIRSIDTFLNWVYNEELIDNLSICHINFQNRQTKYYKEEKMPSMYLTDDELDAMQDVCSNENERLMVVVFRYTAVRSGELSRMKVSQIESYEKDGETRYKIALMETKGDKPRYVELFPELVDRIFDHVKTRKNDSDYIFVGTRGIATNKGITSAGIWKRIKKIASKVVSEDELGRFKPHSIRKSTYTNWLRTNSEKQASLMMGHSSIRVSRENYEQRISDSIPSVFESQKLRI